MFHLLLMTLLTAFTQLPAQAKPETNVVLITLDGVRWQEIFNGTDPILSREHLNARQLLPNLYDLFVDQGIAIGQKSPIVASGPNHISLPGYLEITRGHPSTDCQSNDCYPVIDQSIFDLFEHPTLISSWEQLARTVPTNSNTIINAGRYIRSQSWRDQHLSEYQEYPSYFHNPNYRPDIHTMSIALDYWLETKNNPDLLFLSLGDSDEYGHLNNYNGYLAALNNADVFIGLLVKQMETTDYGKNTVFIITADHGRNLNFRDHGTSSASARVWLLMHGKGIPNIGSVHLKHQISLSNVFPTIEQIAWGIKTPNSILEMVSCISETQK